MRSDIHHREEPGSFEAEWTAQIWRGFGEDTFRLHQRYDLDWDLPTSELLRETVTKLLLEAKQNLSRWQEPQVRFHE